MKYTQIKIVMLIVLAALLLAGCSAIEELLVPPAPAGTAEIIYVLPSETPDLSTATPIPAGGVYATEEVVATEAVGGLTLTDGRARQVTIPLPIERIVSLHAGVSEVLFRINQQALLVARSEDTIFSAEVLSVPAIATNDGQYDLAAIQDYQPDIVFVSENVSDQWIAQATAAGLTVYAVGAPPTLAMYYQTFNDLGAIVNQPRQVTELVNQLKDRILTVQTALQGVQDQPKIFYEVGAQNPEQPVTVGAQSNANLFLTLAGAQYLGAERDNALVNVEFDQLKQYDPQMIILADSSLGVTPGSLADRNNWSQLSAVKNQQVYMLDGDSLAYFSPRNVDALEVLARYFHPQQFP